MEEEKTKKTKPFYKKAWFIVLIIILALSCFSKVSEKVSSMKKGVEIDQSRLALGEYLPKLPNKKGEIGNDSDNYLRVRLFNVSMNDFNEYIDLAKENYNVESYSNGTSSYSAYDKEQYKLDLSYYERAKELTIDLKAPKNKKDIVWPTSELVSLLPVPKSLKGEVSSESSTGYAVYIGNTSENDYNEYVSTCMESGFNVDYSKSEKYYSAKNENGYSLEVNYTGGNTMYIYIKTPEKTNTESSTETTSDVSNKADETPTNISKEENKPSVSEQTSSSTDTKKSTTTNGISKEFKDFMDSYEEYIDEYVEFMKKYNANSSDLTMITQYGKMLQKYTEYADKFEKYDDDHEMTKEETQYYIDVQTRVNKKLLEVSM